MVQDALVIWAQLGVAQLIALSFIVVIIMMTKGPEGRDVMIEEQQRAGTWLAVTASIAGIVFAVLVVISWPLQELVERFWSTRAAIVLLCIGLAGATASLGFVVVRTADPVAKGRIRSGYAIAALGLLPLFLAAALSMHGAPPAQWWARGGSYIQLLSDDPLRVGEAFYEWGRQAAMAGAVPAPWLGALGAMLAILLVGLIQNPYQWRRTLHGSARLATMEDLRRWARHRASLFSPLRKAVNMLEKGGIVLGKFCGRALQCNQTLSALVLARPGAGKTAGIAMPTILSKGVADWSLFIFDIKGELFEETGGWRSAIGPVFRFEPKGRTGARWNPLSVTKSLPNGTRFLELRRELMQVLAASYGDGEGAEDARIRLFNFMEDRDAEDWKGVVRRSPEQLASSAEEGSTTPPPARLPDAAERTRIIDIALEMRAILGDWETQLARYGNALIPDNPNAGPNKHFDETGREAMLGMMGFIIFRCLRQGLEPTMGRVVDAWTEAAGTKPPSEEGNEATDAIETMLWDWIGECDSHGYPRRYKQALVTLVTKAPNERASVISTADKAFNIFKLATVKERTSTSDFAIDDLRGVKGADGKLRPMTLYIVVSLEDIKTMAPILMMLTETSSNRLISQPAKVAKRARPVLYILDEFAQIPKMQCLLSGPAVGRGMKVANLLIAQSEGQIAETYGKDGLQTLRDTTEWKILFPLTDTETAKRYSELIGKTTVRTKSTSGTDGIFAAFFSKQGDILHQSASKQLQGLPLFDVSDLMSEGDDAKLPAGYQLVIVGGRAARPVLAETPLYFKDKTLVARAKLPPPGWDEARGYCGKLGHLAPAETQPPAANDDVVVPAQVSTADMKARLYGKAG